MTKCTHTSSIRVTEVGKLVCEECVRLGDSWVHLRMCLTCGNVGCCDSSANQHASAHFRKTTHPLIRSAQPGESWVWCYVDEVIAGELPA
jgi:uncharacterized UBP type Zn finger protein